MRRDYCDELPDGQRRLATGRLSSAEPIEVGDTVELAGIVERIEPVMSDNGLLVVARLQERG